MVTEHDVKDVKDGDIKNDAIDAKDNKEPEQTGTEGDVKRSAENAKDEGKGTLEQPKTKEDTDVKLNAADIYALIEKARKEEKAKLYPEIEELKKAVKERDKVIEELKAKLNDLEKAKEVEKPEQDNKTNEIYIKEIETLKDEIKSLKKYIKEQEEKLAKAEREKQLAEYREKIIKKYGLEDVAEFVKGNSEVEIDASAQIAMKKLEEIKEKIANELKSKINVPEVNTTQSEPETIDISKMTLEEYAKYREILLKKAREARKGA